MSEKNKYRSLCKKEVDNYLCVDFESQKKFTREVILGLVHSHLQGFYIGLVYHAAASPVSVRIHCEVLMQIGPLETVEQRRLVVDKITAWRS